MAWKSQLNPASPVASPSGRSALTSPARLRVRTGASQGQRGVVAWAVHADHVVTAAQAEAASRAIEAALDGEPLPAPFHVLVRRAQREMLRLVPPEAGRTG